MTDGDEFNLGRIVTNSPLSNLFSIKMQDMINDEFDLTAAFAESQIRERIRRGELVMRNPDWFENENNIDQEIYEREIERDINKQLNKEYGIVKKNKKCPECGGKWDIEHDRCSCNCQTIDKK